MDARTFIISTAIALVILLCALFSRRFAQIFRKDIFPAGVDRNQCPRCDHPAKTWAFDGQGVVTRECPRGHVWRQRC